jgi:hypothetical protein
MNLLDHGAADTLGSIGAIMSVTLSREQQWHIGVPRSTATGSPKGSADAARQRRRSGHPAATSEWHGVHFAALIRTSEIF